MLNIPFVSLHICISLSMYLHICIFVPMHLHNWASWLRPSQPYICVNAFAYLHIYVTAYDQSNRILWWVLEVECLVVIIPHIKISKQINVHHYSCQCSIWKHIRFYITNAQCVCVSIQDLGVRGCLSQQDSQNCVWTSLPLGKYI